MSDTSWVKIIIGSCLGAGLALGSCGSCNIGDKITSSIKFKVDELGRRVETIGGDLTRKIEEYRASNQIPQGTVYKIDKKDYLCVPLEQK